MKFTDAKNGGGVQHGGGDNSAKGATANSSELILGRQRTSRNENADYSGIVHLKPQSSTTSRSNNNLNKVSQKSIGISKQNQSSKDNNKASSSGGTTTSGNNNNLQNQETSKLRPKVIQAGIQSNTLAPNMQTSMTVTRQNSSVNGQHARNNAANLRLQAQQSSVVNIATTRQKSASNSQQNINTSINSSANTATASNVPQQTASTSNQLPAASASGTKESQQKSKRTKERTIQEIIEKVSTWRKLYNGVIIPNAATGEFQLQRWSLEDAAKKVKVSKKSLDDYLLQLRFGKKFGFDFHSNNDKKVGVLRCFVKEMKDKLKQKNGNKKMSSKLPLQQSSSKRNNGGGDDDDMVDVDDQNAEDFAEESDEQEEEQVAAVKATGKGSKGRGK